MKSPRLGQCFLAAFGTIAATVALGALLLSVGVVVDHAVTSRWVSEDIRSFVAFFGTTLVLGGLVSVFHTAIGAIIYWLFARALGMKIWVALSIGVLISTTLYAGIFGSIPWRAPAGFIIETFPQGLIAGATFHLLIKKISTY